MTGPKSIVSLNEGLRAWGKSSAATTVPTLMSTLRNSSKAIVGIASGFGVMSYVPIRRFASALSRRPKRGQGFEGAPAVPRPASPDFDLGRAVAPAVEPTPGLRPRAPPNTRPAVPRDADF